MARNLLWPMQRLPIDSAVHPGVSVDPQP